jgi:hypothetical protein
VCKTLFNIKYFSILPRENIYGLYAILRIKSDKFQKIIFIYDLDEIHVSELILICCAPVLMIVFLSVMIMLHAVVIIVL